MSRSLDATNEATLDDDFIVPVVFVSLDFDTDPVFVHTDLGTITTTTPSATWLGVGDLGRVGTIEEAVKPSPYKLDLLLTLVDESADSIYSEALTQNYFLRDGTLYLGFRNTVTGALVSNTLDELFHGTIENLRVVHGGALPDAPSFVQVTLESELAIFKQSAGGLYSNAQLQEEYPGTASPLDPDTFFRHLERFVNKRIPWGPDGRVGFISTPGLPAEPGDEQYRA